MSSSATAIGGTTRKPTAGRWGIVIAALLLQFSIGAVYAWSVFSTALKKPDAMALTNPEASLPFTVDDRHDLHRQLRRRTHPGPGRAATVALAGGIIYAVGCILASFAAQ